MAWVPAVPGDLIGFYPFDGANPQQDASGSTNELQSAFVNPDYSPDGGWEGGAYEFDGSQRWIVPLDINPGPRPQLTMGAWVKTSSLQPGLRKFIGSDDGGWDRTIGLDNRNGPFRYTSFAGDRPGPGTVGPVSTNHWSFVAASYNQDTSELTLYVDQDVSSIEPLYSVTETAAFGPGWPMVALGSVSPMVQGEGWQGSMDNVFFFDEVLTPERVTEIRNHGRNAILNLPTDDPNLWIVSAPDLGNLDKVPSVKTLTFGITNSGSTANLEITALTIQGPDASYFQVISLPENLAPGQAGEIDIEFNSQGQVGAFAATATLQSNDPSQPTLLLELAAQVTASQTLLGFYGFDDPAQPLADESGAARTLLDGQGGGAADPVYVADGGFGGGGVFEYYGSNRLAAPININPSSVPRLTMGAWLRTSTLTPGLYKALGHDNGGWDRVIGLDNRALAAGGPLADGTFRYAAFTGVNDHGPSQGDPPPTPVSTNDWTFLAADYDQASNRLLLYVDLDASSTADDLQVIEQETQMGEGLENVGIGAISPLGGENWVGAIDNVFFVSGTLDAATMQAVRDGGRATLLQFGPDPVLNVSSDPVFGDLPDGSVVSASIEIRNGGTTQPLEFSQIRLVGRDADLYSLGAFPSSLAPGESSLLEVTLDPQGNEGTLLATLELITNDSTDRNRRLNLNATIPFTDSSAALIGFYTFDNPSNRLEDSSGRGNDLTMVAGAEPVPSANEGFPDGTFIFNGAQRLISPININVSALPQLTMGAWVKTYALSGLPKVIGSDDGGWDRVIGLDNREDGIQRYTTFVGNGPPMPGTPGPENTNDWTFLAATYDQSAAQVTMYVDLDASTTDDPLVAVSAPTGFGTGFSTTSIGSIRPDNANEGWVGLIDNVFFYEAVLSVAELTRLRDEQASVASALKIVDIHRTESSLTITWRSKPILLYGVEYRQSFSAEHPWTPVWTGTGTGLTTTFLDEDPTRLSNPTGFYRVLGEE